MEIEGSSLLLGLKLLLHVTTFCSSASLLRVISRCALAICEAIILLDRSGLLALALRLMTA